MVTSSAVGLATLGVLCLLSGSGRAEQREMASPAECQMAERQPPLAAAKAAQAQNPTDLKGFFQLADAWSDAGCFHQALQVLQSAQAAHLASPELETRLRVARSVLGEEQYFAKLERADAEVKARRAIFRCTSLGDVEACNEALLAKPNDPALLAARSAARANAGPTEGAKNSTVQAANGAPVPAAAAAGVPVPEAAARGVSASAEPTRTAVVARFPPPARPHYSNAVAGDQAH